MPPSLFKKSALTSSGWSDRYPEVNTKPFRLEAFFSKDTQVNTMDMKETLQGLGWKLQNSVTSQKKSPDLWATDVCTCVCMCCVTSPITPSVFLPESSGSFESSPLADPEHPARCPWATSSVRLLRSCSPVCSSCCGGEMKHAHISLKKQMAKWLSTS